MTVSTVSSELLIFLQPTLVCWCVISLLIVSYLVSWCFKPSQPQRITSGLSLLVCHHRLEYFVRKVDCCFQGQGHSEGSKCQ